MLDLNCLKYLSTEVGLPVCSDFRSSQQQTCAEEPILQETWKGGGLMCSPLYCTSRVFSMSFCFFYLVFSILFFPNKYWKEKYVFEHLILLVFQLLESLDPMVNIQVYFRIRGPIQKARTILEVVSSLLDIYKKLIFTLKFEEDYFHCVCVYKLYILYVYTVYIHIYSLQSDIQRTYCG